MRGIPEIGEMSGLELGPVKAHTDNIGEAFGLAGVILLVAVGLRLIAKYL